MRKALLLQRQRNQDWNIEWRLVVLVNKMVLAHFGQGLEKAEFISESFLLKSFQV
jgi:hypothetical protein